jgi:predicted 3-demethylubiquinone-9 3-methyltransferase (glyoxalase superfamily)
VSWRVVPTNLPKLLEDPDQAKADRVMAATLKMKKLVIADMEKAHAG